MGGAGVIDGWEAIVIGLIVMLFLVWGRARFPSGPRESEKPNESSTRPQEGKSSLGTGDRLFGTSSLTR